MISGYEKTELEKLVNALRGKAMYTVALGKNNKPKSVTIGLRKGQMNVYEGGLHGTLSVTIDHMNAVPMEYVLDLLGIEVDA